MYEDRIFISQTYLKLSVFMNTKDQPETMTCLGLSAKKHGAPRYLDN